LCSPNLVHPQNHRIVGVGRDLCGSSSPTLLPKQGHLQQTGQDLVQTGLEYHPYIISYACISILMLSFLWKEKYPTRFMKTILSSVCSQVLYLDDVMMMPFIS